MTCPKLRLCNVRDKFATYFCHIRDNECKDGQRSLLEQCGLDRQNECLGARINQCDTCKA